MEISIKYFIASFLVAYLLIAFLLPSARTYKRTGINPFAFGNGDSPHDYIGRLFKLLLTLSFLPVLTYCMGDSFYQYLLPADFLSTPLLQWAGIILCSMSFIWTVVAQWQMGNSWRIGIDEKHQTSLVTSGLFAYSRNPIFLGMQATLAGFFLILPNAITLLVLGAAYMLIQIQTRLEEDFLKRQHGRPYEHYMKNVKRFI